MKIIWCIAAFFNAINMGLDLAKRDWLSAFSHLNICLLIVVIVLQTQRIKELEDE